MEELNVVAQDSADGSSEGWKNGCSSMLLLSHVPMAVMLFVIS